MLVNGGVFTSDEQSSYMVLDEASTPRHSLIGRSRQSFRPRFAEDRSVTDGTVSNDQQSITRQSSYERILFSQKATRNNRV